tara:strand:+ start:124 stop:252 length:129 start_codon:yes stop_codon:yes gene_type:complete
VVVAELEGATLLLLTHLQVVQVEAVHIKVDLQETVELETHLQ